MSRPALPAVQGIPGQRANWEAHSGTEDPAVLVYEHAPRSGTAKYCARVLQGARHSAGVS